MLSFSRKHEMHVECDMDRSLYDGDPFLKRAAGRQLERVAAKLLCL